MWFANILRLTSPGVRPRQPGNEPGLFLSTLFPLRYSP